MDKLHICLITSSLGIGGAETHILTLADALCKRGHRVTLLSDGEYHGPHRHLSLPLLHKAATPLSVAALAAVLRRERFDVIHAHARFPALLCRLAGAAPLVCTAHWVFRTDFPRRALTVWGERTLAVSEDVRRYLMREYALPPTRITVTVNGIDTERYRPERREAERVRITLCSRLDADRAAAAYALIAVSARLCSPIPFTVSIVGDGSEFSRLYRLAESVNRACGEERVRMLGAREDVEKILGVTDIFVGVSRAALEAMAAACAVVLAGNEGYLSVFSPDNAARAEESNFCCRGAERLSLAALERDLSYLLHLSAAQRAEMGERCRCYVCARYSADRMAEDALTVYRAVVRREAVLCGYYGFGNVGDELMRRALLSRLRAEGYRRVYLLSARGGHLPAARALRRGAALVLGGGNLLQDGTSYRSLLFYLQAAHAGRGERHLISAGIGPLSARGRRATRRALVDFSTIECRTAEDSAEMLALLRPTAFRGRVYTTSDAVLGLTPPPTHHGTRVLLALRPYTPTDTVTEYDFWHTLDNLLHAFSRDEWVLFPMHPEDTAFCRALGARHGVRVVTGDADDFLSLLATCRLAVGNRLHLGVTALAFGIPSLLFPQDEKIERFARDARGVATALGRPAPCALLHGDIPTITATREDILAVSRALRARRTLMEP